MIPADLPTAIVVHHHADASDPISDSLNFSEHVSKVVAEAIRIQEAEAQASRAQEREEASAVSGPSSLPAGLLCVRDHESGGNYTVINSLGYSGAYQFSPVYWSAWAKRYGYNEWASTHPASAPPAVQDGVALGLWNDGAGVWKNWASYTCDWPS